MKAPLSYVPLLPALLSLAAGVLLFRAVDSVWIPCLLLGAGIAMILVRQLVPTCVAAGILAGWCTAYIHLDNDDTHPSLPRGCTVEGVVISSAEQSYGQTVDVEINGIMAPDSSISSVYPFRIRATVNSLFPEFIPGQIIRFSPESLTDPTDYEPDLPDELNTGESVWNRGIALRAYVTSEKVTITGIDSSPRFKLMRLRNAVIRLIFNSGIQDGTAMFLAAAIMGDDSMLTPESRRLFAASGQAHVLALSGAHVAIIAALIALALFPLTLAGFNDARTLLTITALWIYAVMTGLSPSVTRAVIMTSMVLGAYLLRRRNSAFNALAAAAILIIFFDPGAMFQPGFQLSFSAVAAILLLAEKMNPIPRRWGNMFYGIGTALTLPIVAMLGTAVISVSYFHIFPVYFLLSAIPSGYILSALISGGILLIITEYAGIPHGWLNSILDTLYGWSVKIMETVSSMPHAVIERIYPDSVTIALAIGAIVMTVCLIHLRRRIYAVAALTLVAGCVVTETLLKPDYPTHELYLTRRNDSTNILIRHDNTMTLYTTTPPQLRHDKLAQCRFRYADYIGKRGIDSLSLAPTHFADDKVEITQQYIRAGNITLMVIADNCLPRVTGRPDYAIVCRGFRGDITTLADSIRPARIILSHDLSKQRHDRYLRELESLGLDVHSMRRDGTFHLIF